MRGLKTKMKRLPPSAMPLGALYVCDNCPTLKVFDATRAAYHRQRTAHTLTLVMEIS